MAPKCWPLALAAVVAALLLGAAPAAAQGCGGKPIVVLYSNNAPDLRALQGDSPPIDSFVFAPSDGARGGARARRRRLPPPVGFSPLSFNFRNSNPL
jgi:hypothetical protein